jgi:hypothetical protein
MPADIASIFETTKDTKDTKEGTKGEHFGECLV